MAQHRNVSFTPGLRVFISKVITPVVLVAGLIVLIFFNFRGVLKTTTSANDHFQGNVAFSQGAFSYHFKQTAGNDRPKLVYNSQDLISYVEWSSTLAMDGNVQQLWNDDHGYSVDESKNQSFSTITDSNWQLTEIVTLVDDHTVTVTYMFVPQPQNIPAPTRYVLDIKHLHNTWYNYQANSDTFTALVAGGDPITGTQKPATIGAITLKVVGDAAAHPLLKVDGTRGTTDAKGTVNLANTFLTEYVVENPTPQRLITLGTETITFQPDATSVGAPLNGTVPLPSIPGATTGN